MSKCNSSGFLPSPSGTPRRRGAMRRLTVLLAALALAAAGSRGGAAETSLTEYQVKALFLVSFAKYVDWPPAAFAGDDAPIVIGVAGGDKFAGALAKAAEGRLVAGRRIVVEPGDAAEPGSCQILFVGEAARQRLGEILEQSKSRPVLTVGESPQFLEHGGVINFVKREGKVRLEINLAAARQAQLAISSKLLSVADSVTGRLD